MCMSLCCHRNLCFGRVIENVIKYDLYDKLPQSFARDVQICAKFCCKNFYDVCQVFQILHHYTYGGHFFVDTLYVGALNGCRKCRWWSRWLTTIASVRQIQLAASHSAVRRPAPSCVIGATCWQTRADRLRSGTRCRRCRRSSVLLATLDSACRVSLTTAWMLWASRNLSSSVLCCAVATLLLMSSANLFIVHFSIFVWFLQS